MFTHAAYSHVFNMGKPDQQGAVLTNVGGAVAKRTWVWSQAKSRRSSPALARRCRTSFMKLIYRTFCCFQATTCHHITQMPPARAYGVLAHSRAKKGTPLGQTNRNGPLNGHQNPCENANYQLVCLTPTSSPSEVPPFAASSNSFTNSW